MNVLNNYAYLPKQDFTGHLLASVVKPFLSSASVSQISLWTKLLVCGSIFERGFDPCIDNKNRRHGANGVDVQWGRVGHFCGGSSVGGLKILRRAFWLVWLVDFWVHARPPILRTEQRDFTSKSPALYH